MQACIDEAGRGCMLGRVYSASVIWNTENTHKLLKDSKKLTPNQITIMYDYVIDNAIDYGVGFAEPREIDAMNILKATQLSMRRALDSLVLDIDDICVDGNYFEGYKDVPYQCIIQGDSSMPGISAASIVAKYTRDAYIADLCTAHEELHTYKIHKNKGYCTKDHIDGIKQHGRTEHHRKTFLLPTEKLCKI